VTTVLREGLPSDEILAEAARLHPDLIAMGTHGRRRVERWIMGSTAERVVQLASPPVLTVSSDDAGAHPRIRQVLCPVDLEVGSETLAFAGGLAGASGSVLRVMHVVEGALDRASGARLEARLRARLRAEVPAAGQRIRTETLVRAGRPSREILRAAHERAVDLIVMGVHAGLTAPRGLLGRTADEVVRSAECAVITVPSRAVRRPAEARPAVGTAAKASSRSGIRMTKH
jgi:nucleotide-binding universal stress UspA family protein